MSVTDIDFLSHFHGHSQHFIGIHHFLEMLRVLRQPSPLTAIKSRLLSCIEEASFESNRKLLKARDSITRIMIRYGYLIEAPVVGALRTYYIGGPQASISLAQLHQSKQTPRTRSFSGPAPEEKRMFLVCYKSLKDANFSLELLLKYFKENPCSYVLSLEIREKTIKSVRPYWLGVVGLIAYFSKVDRWFRNARIETAYHFADSVKYREFKDQAQPLRRFNNINGVMVEN